MRVNIYAEEMTDRVALVKKGEFSGVRFYLELPVSLQGPPTELGAKASITHMKGPLVHHHGDDDSAAVTFWGKRQLKENLEAALRLLEAAHGNGANKATDTAQVNLQAASIHTPRIEEILDLFQVHRGPNGYFLGLHDFAEAIQKIVRLTGGSIR